MYFSKFAKDNNYQSTMCAGDEVLTVSSVKRQKTCGRRE